jgi:predicted DNA-binding transcriptional regulator YafY
MRLWRLDRIVSADLLDRAFQRREDFSLSAYAAQSFGVFQEEPIDVVLRFAPEAAEDTARWLFHPSQSITHEADSAMTVRFCAGGMQEMCWHLFTGGTAVTVLAPKELRMQLAGLAATAAAHHRGRGDRFVWRPEDIQRLDKPVKSP